MLFINLCQITHWQKLWNKQWARRGSSLRRHLLKTICIKVRFLFTFQYQPFTDISLGARTIYFSLKPPVETIWPQDRLVQWNQRLWLTKPRHLRPGFSFYSIQPFWGRKQTMRLINSSSTKWQKIDISNDITSRTLSSLEPIGYWVFLGLQPRIRFWRDTSGLRGRKDKIIEQSKTDTACERCSQIGRPLQVWRLVFWHWRRDSERLEAIRGQEHFVNGNKKSLHFDLGFRFVCRMSMSKSLWRATSIQNTASRSSVEKLPMAWFTLSRPEMRCSGTPWPTSGSRLITTNGAAVERNCWPPSWKSYAVYH